MKSSPLPFVVVCLALLFAGDAGAFQQSRNSAVFFEDLREEFEARRLVCSDVYVAEDADIQVMSDCEPAYTEADMAALAVRRIQFADSVADRTVGERFATPVEVRRMLVDLRLSETPFAVIDESKRYSADRDAAKQALLHLEMGVLACPEVCVTREELDAARSGLMQVFAESLKSG